MIRNCLESILLPVFYEFPGQMCRFSHQLYQCCILKASWQRETPDLTWTAVFLKMDNSKVMQKIAMEDVKILIIKLLNKSGRHPRYKIDEAFVIFVSESFKD